MQDSLFDEPEPPSPKVGATARARGAKVQAAAHDAGLSTLASALPPTLRLGTSSWSFPGWIGSVWQGEHADALLAKHGLNAYAAHPLLRTVSLDRAFYRPLSVTQYAAYATQVPEDFRFVVKAPSLVADATIRGEDGRGLRANPSFLNAELAIRDFVEPASAGLRQRLGALVFQLSPLPSTLLSRLPEVIDAIGEMLRALPDVRAVSPDAVIAVEVRDAAFLTPAFAKMLRACGATYCLGLHAKLPEVEAQLPMLRALWPGPLVCRWSLNRRHGAFGYEEAKRLYGRFDRLVDPDVASRRALARIIAGTTAAGHPAYVTINNKAEGSAPLSVVALAETVREFRRD